MTEKSRFSRRVLLAGMSALPFVSPRAFAQAVKKGGTLTFLMTNEPNVLMSFATTATTALTVSAKTTEGLLEYDYHIKALTAAESPMVPRHLYEGTDPLTNQNGNAPVGTGPYLFKEWVRGSHVIFERNPNYWNPDLPRIDRMVCKFVPDPGARSIA